jgi:2-C-methyl-D-erythritol 2,4-cyclodiphosphate synthase
MIRIGHGYDVHAFGGDSPLILGGVTVANHQGLIAHSDGDVLLHAVCDAMLGAAALGDIGSHFPDTDAAYSNVNSRSLLKKVLLLTSQKGFSINNIDVTVVAQTPRLSPIIKAIVSNLSSDLQLEETQVNVKATTTESLGYIGRKEGIAVHCVCLLVQT